MFGFVFHETKPYNMFKESGKTLDFTDKVEEKQLVSRFKLPAPEPLCGSWTSGPTLGLHVCSHTKITVQ